MHAPHRPVPQPNLVPVSLRPSRITHNNGVAGGASVDAALLFTVKLVDMVSSLDVTARDVTARDVTPRLPCSRCSKVPHSVPHRLPLQSKGPFFVDMSMINPL